LEVSDFVGRRSGCVLKLVAIFVISVIAAFSSYSGTMIRRTSFARLKGAPGFLWSGRLRFCLLPRSALRSFNSVPPVSVTGAGSGTGCGIGIGIKSLASGIADIAMASR